MHLKYNVDEKSLITYLIEDRRSKVSQWGIGNSKLGPSIYTYSKLPGSEYSCPGSSEECESICFAKKVVKNEWVWRLWTINNQSDDIPPLPDNAKIVRLHVSGDFNSIEYIQSWQKIVASNPSVTFFGYTRSWRVTELLNDLESLKNLPNMFLWASIDKTIKEIPPVGWRRAWIEGDDRLENIPNRRTMLTFDKKKAVVCPEEAGLIQNCEKCTFCFKNGSRDLVFLKH